MRIAVTKFNILLIVSEKLMTSYFYFIILPKTFITRRVRVEK